MSELPQVPGARLVRTLQKAGFVVKRQQGSHVILRHSTDFSRRTVVPVHGSTPVKPGTLRAILKGVGLTVEELKRLL
ncbi:MAG: type II toxin-antitoxin system HicA family toxin [Candidatus Omnitrophica bacterium]|nr:type II toxin-antitoxin system HicA family toxin [Candidatus Omnitrophota bacterium]